MVLITDKRIGYTIWLVCAAAIAGLGFWYPETVANRNAAPDDRFGGVLMVGIPFEIIGGILALRAMFGLVVIMRQTPSKGTRVLMLSGVLLMIFSLSPLVIIGSRILR